MDRWISYFKNRFRISVSLLGLLGFSLSGLLIDRGYFQTFPFIFSFVGLLLFFTTWGMMNDLRNFEKEKIANPNHPLACGLLYYAEFELVVRYMQGALFLYGLLLWPLFSWDAAFTFLLMTIYLWHIGRDFFIPKWLERHPLVNLVTSQVVILLVAFFTIAIGRPAELTAPAVMWYAFLVFGAFFTFAIASKLNPQEHPIFRHLVQFYGYHRTYYVAVLMVVITAFSASALGMGKYLWPPEAAVALGLTFLFFNSNRYGFVEKLAGISLLVHLWAGAVQRFL